MVILCIKKVKTASHFQLSPVHIFLALLTKQFINLLFVLKGTYIPFHASYLCTDNWTEPTYQWNMCAFKYASLLPCSLFRVKWTSGWTVLKSSSDMVDLTIIQDKMSHSEFQLFFFPTLAIKYRQIVAPHAIPLPFCHSDDVSVTTKKLTAGSLKC